MVHLVGNERLDRPDFATLAIVATVEHGAPPVEFRIFGAGWNETENGSYLFDSDAASATMSAYRAHGVDRMIDLEHLSLDAEARHYDPDARGWARLELRDDGSLWAVDVRWTDDGRARLTERRQRYISPAFRFDPESRRVLSVWNIALTAMPATREAAALVAASLRRASAAPEHAQQSSPAEVAVLSTNGARMDPNLIGPAIDALIAGDAKSALDILKNLVVSAASAESVEEAPASEPAPEADAVPMADAAAVPPPEEDPKKKDPALAAASARLMRLSGKTTLGAALADVEAWRASHLAYEAEAAKLAVERTALEAGERRKLVADLVKLGAETPHTSGLATGTVCKRLADEPLDELRSRVAALSKRPASSTPQPPVESSSLSARELAMCSAKKIDPAVYAKTKGAIRARSMTKES